jgi:hypothetical protein
VIESFLTSPKILPMKEDVDSELESSNESEENSIV